MNTLEIVDALPRIDRERLADADEMPPDHIGLDCLCLTLQLAG